MAATRWTNTRDLRVTSLSLLAVGAILALHYGTTLHRLGLHDLLRRLFYLPVIIAAIAGGSLLPLVGMLVGGFAEGPRPVPIPRSARRVRERRAS